MSCRDRHSGGTTIDATTTIQALARDDLPAVGVLFRAHTGRPADLATMGRWLAQAPAAAAHRAGDLVGYLLAKPFAPDVIELASLLVAPSARGQGLGTALVHHVEDEARARGMRAIVAAPSSGYVVLGPKRSTTPLFRRLGYEVLLQTPATSILGRLLDAVPPS